MVENSSANNTNDSTYADIERIVTAEKSGKPATDEQKQGALQKLKDLADRSDSFDPEQLDSIIAFAQMHDNNGMAESILKRAQDQKNALNNVSANIYDDKVPVECQPSYNVFKEHERLIGKENLTTDEQKRLGNIEKSVATILQTADKHSIDQDNAVDYENYLAISSKSKNKDVAHNEELNSVVEEKLKDYDKNNGLEDLEGKAPEALNANGNAWMKFAKDNNLRIPMPEAFNELPEQEAQVSHKIITTALISELRTEEPKDNAKEVWDKTVDDIVGEYTATLNTEYLKLSSMRDYCVKNNLTHEQFMGKITKDNNFAQQYSQYEQQYLADKLPNFNGSYTDKQFLQTATNRANATLCARTTTRECRIARITGAPQISKATKEQNNNFAKKHPKLYAGLQWGKLAGPKIGKDIAVTFLVGASLGPAGLAGLSAYKCVKSIRQSYSQFKKDTQQSGIKNFFNHMKKRENRAQLIGMVGQVGLSAVSGYFACANGFENMDWGAIGKMLGHTNGGIEAVASVTEASNPFMAGVNRFIDSPRRLSSMGTSLAIGASKSLSAWSNQRYGRNQLKDIMQKKYNITLSTADIKKLEKIKNSDELSASLLQIAPQLQKQDLDKALEAISLSSKSNPKTAFAVSAISAGAGLVAAGAMEYFADHEAANSSIDETADTQTTNVSSVENATNVEVSTEENWNFWENGDKNRTFACNCDPNGVQETLKEMGLLDKDAKFMTSRETMAYLDQIKADNSMSVDQANQLQAFFDDRDGRLANMNAWNEAHPQVNDIEFDRNPSSVMDPYRDAQSVKLEDLEGKDLNQVVLDAQPEPVAPVEEVYNYHIKGKIDGKQYEGDAVASNPISAVQAFCNENEIHTKEGSKLVITDEAGGKTKLQTKIKDNGYEESKIEQYDPEGKKILTQKDKYYANGAHEREVKDIDVDGDGRNDKIKFSENVNAYGGPISSQYTDFGKGRGELLTQNVVDGEVRTTRIHTDDLDKVQRPINSDTGRQYSSSDVLKNAHKEMHNSFKNAEAPQQNVETPEISSNDNQQEPKIVNNPDEKTNSEIVETKMNKPNVMETSKTVDEPQMQETKVNNPNVVEAQSAEVQAPTPEVANGSMANVRYSITQNPDGSLSSRISGSLTPEGQASVDKMMQETKLYRNSSNGTYRCGLSRSTDLQMAIDKERNSLRDLALRSAVVQDLEARGSLSPAETKFVQQFNHDLEQRGFSKDDLAMDNRGGGKAPASNVAENNTSQENTPQKPSSIENPRQDTPAQAQEANATPVAEVQAPTPEVANGSMANVRYSITQNPDGSLSANISGGLTPEGQASVDKMMQETKIYRNSSNGSYRCGLSRSNNLQMAINKERFSLQQLALKSAVVQDLEARGNLSPAETKFIQQFNHDMEQRGFSKDYFAMEGKDGAKAPVSNVAENSASQETKAQTVEAPKHEATSNAQEAAPATPEVSNSVAPIANVKYSITFNKDGSLNANVSGNLTPEGQENLSKMVNETKITRTADGKYQCGSSKSTNMQMARDKERIRLRELSIKSAVVQDLEAKGNMSPAEARFVQEFNRDLEKRGLSKEDFTLGRKDNANTASDTSKSAVNNILTSKGKQR